MVAALLMTAKKDKFFIPYLKSIPFWLCHLMPLGALWTGANLLDWILCFGLFGLRMFFITAAYHRYFAHRSFKTSRLMQFVFAFGGAMAAQRGPLWWAGLHRHHHRYSDQPEDIHSPKKGFWWSHVGWFLDTKYDKPDHSLIPDMAKYPELRFLDRFHLIPPAILATTVFLVGGWSALFIGFFLSTVFVWHATFTINSLAHLWGKRRYETTDTSRNSWPLALLTFGEGWHNNHHYYPASVRQGFFWWEIDLSYYLLKGLSWLRLVWDLKLPSSEKIKVSPEESKSKLEEGVLGAA